MSNLKARFPGGGGGGLQGEGKEVSCGKFMEGLRITEVMGLDSIKNNGNHKPAI